MCSKILAFMALQVLLYEVDLGFVGGQMFYARVKQLLYCIVMVKKKRIIYRQKGSFS